MTQTCVPLKGEHVHIVRTLSVNSLILKLPYETCAWKFNVELLPHTVTKILSNWNAVPHWWLTWASFLKTTSHYYNFKYYNDSILLVNLLLAVQGCLL